MSQQAPCWSASEDVRGLSLAILKFLDAAALLNAYSPYISLVAISRLSGINQNQLSQYANGLKNARPNQMKRILEAVCEIGKELSAAVI